MTTTRTALPLTVSRPAAGDLPLDRSEVMRYLGYKPGVTRLEQRHEELLDRGIALAIDVAEPAVTTAYCSIDIAGDTVTTRVPGLAWRSRSLAKLLGDAAGVTLVAGTLGESMETLTRRLFAEEEYALATIVDAAGSALVHGLGLWAQAQLTPPPDMTLTPLYGPGYGDWEITDQLALTVAAGADAIGLTCTETCYLLPQKSLVGIIGWTARAGRAASGCALCTMPNCAYRLRG